MRITGYIYGADNKPVKALVTLVDNSFDSVAVQEILPGEKYTIDADPVYFPDLVAIFSAEGYQDKEVSVMELTNSGPDIHLSKSVLTGIVLMGALAAGVALARKKKRVGKVTGSDITPVILVVGGLLAVNMISRILDKLGLGGDPTRGPQSDPDSPFKPAYWRQFTVFSYVINRAQAAEYAKKIHDAFTVVQDDFNAIMSVFSALRTKSNVSYLADIFSQEYGEDLLSFLTDGGGILPWDGLSKDHLNTILSYVEKLPAY